MFVVQITETQMQIEINGDAARLQLKHREIKSLHVSASELARLDLCLHEFENECPDCGDCVVCCRCCPGEG